MTLTKDDKEGTIKFLMEATAQIIDARTHISNDEVGKGSVLLIAVINKLDLIAKALAQSAAPPPTADGKKSAAEIEASEKKGEAANELQEAEAERKTDKVVDRFDTHDGPHTESGDTKPAADSREAPANPKP